MFHTLLLQIQLKWTTLNIVPIFQNYLLDICHTFANLLLLTKCPWQHQRCLRRFGYALNYTNILLGLPLRGQ